MFIVSRFYLLKRFPDDPAPAPAPAPAPENPPQSDPKPEVPPNSVALAKALKEARENSVPKAEYDRLKEENKKLVSEIINGSGDDDDDGHKAPASETTIEELREALYGPKCSQLSNLDYWTKTLALRDLVIQKGEPDPFLPSGAKISPQQEDIDKANNVAKVVQECIDEADGNSEVFTAILQSRTNPDSPQFTAHLKKLGIKNK